ncbi:hypothetical protein F2Q68_00002398 [Brassica cretica]|uniref:Uncharacterized protein n=1 Tax=Brassica cretica TaxID=69181 RepID=A0A8S9JML1_BRACR|nr:hypothetical protein F2Q68_00002398 [Brassica cretica]
MLVSVEFSSMSGRDKADMLGSEGLFRLGLSGVICIYKESLKGGDNNNGPAGDDTVVAKVETGGSSEQSAMNTGTAPTGDEQKTPPENASLKMVKKALMAWHKL